MIRRYRTNQQRIKARIRAKISGTAERPRISVFRSTGHIYAQLIDDEKGVTLCAASDCELDKQTKATKVVKSFASGQLLAEKAKKLSIKRAVFDRNGRAYHGRVAEFARGVREGGIEI